MCWPIAIGLALAAGGAVAGAAAKQKADNAQSRVLGDALRVNTDTRNKNRSLLMGQVGKNAPENVAALNAGAAGQSQAAEGAQANDAVRLFEGARGNTAASGQVAGRVMASQAPRQAAFAQLEGQAEGGRRLAMSADRTNALIDGNNAWASRQLGLVPYQMQVAGQSGRGLALAGQALGAVGNGVTSYGMWQPAAGASGQYINPYNTGVAGTGGYATYGSP